VEDVIGGIIQTIEGVKADPINAFDVATGLARVIFSSFIGWFSFFAGIGLSNLIYGSSSVKLKRKRFF